MESLLFTPAKIGPIEIKNRVIRASAYEGMCDGHVPTQQLKDYHTAVARGGVGMTSVAYASINKSGLSFHRQLWMRPEIIPGLRDLTDSIHAAGAKACIQLGHCGNMSHRMYCGQRPVGASSGFNMYSPTFVHGLRKDEILQTVKDFGNAVRIARDGGFDAVEIHAGHGYLISQFLSPYTNHRRDEFGGPLENRMKFMDMVMEEVMKAAGDDIAVLVKTNTRDGFKGGLEVEDCIKVAKRLEQDGAHCLVLSGGFVSRAPMYVMRGAMPISVLTGYMPWRLWWLKLGVNLFGKIMVKDEPFKDWHSSAASTPWRPSTGCSTPASSSWRWPVRWSTTPISSTSSATESAPKAAAVTPTTAWPASGTTTCSATRTASSPPA